MQNQNKIVIYLSINDIIVGFTYLATKERTAFILLSNKHL